MEDYGQLHRREQNKQSDIDPKVISILVLIVIIIFVIWIIFKIL